jgi:hypothetical protein
MNVALFRSVHSTIGLNAIFACSMLHASRLLLAMRLSKLATIFSCLFCTFGKTKASEDEFRLLRDLRQNYDPFERPVADCRQPLTVNITVYLQQILDVVRQFRKFEFKVTKIYVVFV